MVISYKEYECKTVLRIHDYVDNWFWSSASVSPYRACEHACNYCDGRSHRYHVNEKFDQEVQVKINAPEVLEKELKKLYPKQKTLLDFDITFEKKERKARPVILVSSGISDAYQPAEKKYGLTRRLLEILRDYKMPVYVMTKSDLVLRDLDILEDIAEISWCNVSFSMSTIDEKVANIFEPRASQPSKRLKALGRISKTKVLTGITYMPIIPYITDDDQSLEETIREAKSFGARYIIAGTMTMRDEQEKRFYEMLNAHYPGLIVKYKALYKYGYSPLREYQIELYKKVNKLCKKYDILNYLPRYIPDIVLKKNYETSTMLYMIAYVLDLQGENRYKARAFSKSAQIIENLDEDIVDIWKNNEISGILGLGKNITSLIEEFLNTSKCEYLERLKS